MKILFLDHDGVICLSSEWGSRFKSKEGLDSIFDRFNQKALNVLNQIIEKTDCEIVISSDWRYHATLERMGDLYEMRGIKKKPIDYTDRIMGSSSQLESTRADEIKKWLNEHPEVTEWVAVDDLDMSPYLQNFVHTPRSYEGIKQSGIKEKIIKKLTA
jgi:hypothetical protein